MQKKQTNKNFEKEKLECPHCPQDKAAGVGSAEN